MATDLMLFELFMPIIQQRAKVLFEKSDSELLPFE